MPLSSLDANVTRDLQFVAVVAILHRNLSPMSRKFNPLKKTIVSENKPLVIMHMFVC